MEIVKSGKFGNAEVWEVAVTCKKHEKCGPEQEGCGAEMKAGAKDLLLMYWEGTHFTHHYAGIRCPECGKYNRVENVPQPVWEKVNNPANRRKSIFDGFSESIY